MLALCRCETHVCHRCPPAPSPSTKEACSGRTGSSASCASSSLSVVQKALSSQNPLVVGEGHSRADLADGGEPVISVCAIWSLTLAALRYHQVLGVFSDHTGDWRSCLCGRLAPTSLRSPAGRGSACRQQLDIIRRTSPIWSAYSGFTFTHSEERPLVTYRVLVFLTTNPSPLVFVSSGCSKQQLTFAPECPPGSCGCPSLSCPFALRHTRGDP